MTLRELERRVENLEGMLRSLAALCEAIASGVPMGDLEGVMGQTADRIRDTLNPRRGMAEGRRA
jgi:hypothetical protein